MMLTRYVQYTPFVLLKKDPSPLSNGTESIYPIGCRGLLTSTVWKYWNGRRRHLHSHIGQYYVCPMRKQAEPSVLNCTLISLNDLLSGASGLGYAEVKEGPLQVES